MRSAPSATSSSKPIKTEDAVTLENMFDDLEEKSEQDTKEEADINLEKPGNWDSEGLNGVYLYSILLRRKA